VRLVRTLVKFLQERTADGYVFRTDLRLRPDPASTQIAVSTAAALNYYESVGQNWERAALIKARVCAGDVAAGEMLLKELSPFIWRKYLDFAAVTDIEAMKRQIHAYRGHDEIAIGGHNIKLGRGGIREIEFFVQTQQLIAGGRHPAAAGETLAMLSGACGWRLDRRAGAPTTSTTPIGSCAWSSTGCNGRRRADPHAAGRARGREKFARFLGFADRDAFADVLLRHLRNVQRHYATLFEAAPAAEARARAALSRRSRRSRNPRQAFDDGLSPAA
jgi:glutamate-ammonia-ligase adenylyltransferase